MFALALYPVCVESKRGAMDPLYGASPAQRVSQGVQALSAPDYVRVGQGRSQQPSPRKSSAAQLLQPLRQLLRGLGAGFGQGLGAAGGVRAARRLLHHKQALAVQLFAHRRRFGQRGAQAD